MVRAGLFVEGVMWPSLIGTGREEDRRKLLPPVDLSQFPELIIGFKEIAFERGGFCHGDRSSGLSCFYDSVSGNTFEVSPMPSPFERPLFFVLLVTVVWSVAMGIEANGIAPADKVPAGCYFSGKPILDAELVESADCFVAVATEGAADEAADEAAKKVAHNLKLFRVNTWMDFLFIAEYCLVFVLFVFAVDDRWTKWVVIALIMVAALLDVAENTRIFAGLDAVARHASVEGLPRRVSFYKWVLLGVTLGLVGVVVWLRKGRFYRLTAFALLVSGVLTLVGLARPHVMVFAAYGFALSFVLILARVWPYPADVLLLWIEYAYLLRFQIAEAAILALGLPLAYHFVPSLFVGAFDGLNKVSFLVVVWAAFQLAWTIMVTSRLVFVYGPDRFVRASSIHPKRVGAGLVAAFGLLALPVVVVLFLGTAEVSIASRFLAAILGFLLAIGVLVLTASLHFSIEDPGNSADLVFPSFGFLTKTAGAKSSFWVLIGSYLDRHLPDDLKAGILDTTGAVPRLRSGHEMATIALSIFLLLYGFLGVGFIPARANPQSLPAALFFVLLLLTVLTWLFSGAAFFLDRTRLPVFTTLLAVSLLTGVVNTDHKFVVNEKYAAESKITPSAVIEAWKNARSKGNKTALVVATAGGGIRAAAWTAEVMTRLEEKGCTAASDSLVLVSSVSGGSVGSMFVVAPYFGKGKYPSTDADLKAVRFNAKRSSLAAVGWGLAYPDLARTVPALGSAVPETFDRGWSLENTWATGWRENKLPTPTMRSWREDVRQGLRPAVVFNGTASESGERFLVTSTEAPFHGAKEFFDLFPTMDLDVPTAARLSASFPYASPLARASAGPVKNAYHVGDGGYYDNSGLLSAVEWLSDARDNLQGYQVLLILIDARPGRGKEGSSWSWQRQLVGPIQTLLSVRSSSQQVRESIELTMALKYLRTRRSETKEDDAKGTETAALEVIPEPFLFWSPIDPDPPLSWHLTPRQKKEIGGAWAADDNQKSWADVRSKLRCVVDPEILKKAQEEE